ncbi:MAG: hypothetical protein WAO13_28590, partial [Pseudolabrys sp.]
GTKMRVPKVRWDTEYEEADCDELMAGSDDFAIWLDRNGWEIRMKDGCRSETATKLGTVDNLWHMQKPNTATPAWAFHDEDGTPQRQVEYKPYPSAEDLIFGRYNNGEPPDDELVG